MLKNYFTVALRTLRKHKGHTAINVLGLVVGIACCLLIVLFVRSELSYDRFHERSDRLYRAYVDEQYEGDRQILNTVTPIPLAPRLVSSFPEVEAGVRIYGFTDSVRRGARQFTERMYLADSTFFEVFSFPLRQGDPATVLDQPGSVVLTEAAARKYFGEADPMGQTLTARVGGTMQELTVTGVAEAPPAASSIQFDILVPWAMNGFRESSRQAWFQVYPETYVLLREGASGEALEAKLPAMVRQVIPEDFEGQYTVGLQAITDIHLDTAMPAGLQPTSDPAYSYILAAIALFILLIACINFVTLSLGRSADRAKEVGVRKAIGAHRRQLAGQFWGETILVVATSVILGLVTARLLLPFFNDLAGRELELALGAPLLLTLFALLAVVGLVAGAYPALVLSGFRPAEVLRGRLPLQGDRSLLRRGLVVVQFALAMILVASTLVMARQLGYLQTKNMGFDEEQVAVLPTTGSFDEGFRTYELLRSELSGTPGVAGLTASSFSFGGAGWARVSYDADDGQYRTFHANFAGYDYVETLDLRLVAGRSFSREVSADTSRGILVNEALVAAYGWENPVGQRLPGPFPDHEVIGVVEDFHYASLHTPVEPLVITPKPSLVLRGSRDVMFPGDPTPVISVRLRGHDVQATLARIEEVWKRVAPEQPYSFTFVDAALDSQYRQEQRLSTIVGTASALAILIACLGLLGLAALAAARRTKEIGVRKVLGASVPSIVGLLSKDFLSLVGLAFVVAAPVAYIATSQWLESFAYRVGVGAGPLLLTGLGALAIAWLTVSYQSVRAALSDPVEALRYE